MRERIGAKWTVKEEQIAYNLFTAGQKVGRISETLQRKAGGVRARLIKLGLLDKNTKKPVDPFPDFSPCAAKTKRVYVVDSKPRLSEGREEEEDFEENIELEPALSELEEVESIFGKVSLPLRQFRIKQHIDFQKIKAHIKSIDTEASEYSNYTFKSLNNRRKIRTILYNHMEDMGIKHVKDSFVLDHEELLKRPYFGKVCINQLIAVQDEYRSSSENNTELEMITDFKVIEYSAYSFQALLDVGKIGGRLYNQMQELGIYHVLDSYHLKRHHIMQLKHFGKKSYRELFAVQEEFREISGNLKSSDGETKDTPEYLTVEPFIALGDLTAQEYAATISASLSFLINQKLQPREQDILDRRVFRNEGEKYHTLQELADIWNLSRERIRQIESTAHKKIDRFIRSSNTDKNKELYQLLATIFSKDGIVDLKKIFFFCVRDYTVSKARFIFSIILLSITDVVDYTERVEMFSSYKKELDSTLSKLRSIKRRTEKNLKVLAPLIKAVVFPQETKKFNYFGELDHSVREVSYEGDGISGQFWSKKNNRKVYFESKTERTIYKKLEKCDHVLRYREQPVKIPYFYDSKSHDYYPDVLVHLDTGELLALEVKPLIYMIHQSNLVKALSGLEYFNGEGIGYGVINDRIMSFSDLAEIQVDKDLEKRLTFLTETTKSNWHAGINFPTYEDAGLTELKEIDLASIVVRNDLSYTRKPFKITKLPEHLSFKPFLGKRFKY